MNVKERADDLGPKEMGHLQGESPLSSQPLLASPPPPPLGHLAQGPPEVSVLSEAAPETPSGGAHMRVGTCICVHG